MPRNCESDTGDVDTPPVHLTTWHRRPEAVERGHGSGGTGDEKDLDAAPERPRDVNQLGKLVVGLATRQA